VEKTNEKTKKQVIERRATLDEAKTDEMLAVLIRNQEAFENVQDIFQQKHARYLGDDKSLLWKAVKKYHADHEAMPNKGALIADLHQAIRDNPNNLDEEGRAKLDEFVEYAFDDKEHGKNISKSAVHCRVAIETCKKYLEEFNLGELRDMLVKDGTVPIDAVEVMEQKRAELDQALSLTDVDVGVPFPAGWDTRERVQLFSTGCETLDHFLGGGWRAPEIILFMGPYGSCKTTLVCHSVGRLIEECQKAHDKALKRWQKKGSIKGKEPKRPVVVLVFTEGSKDDYRIRILSHMARVLWKRLATMRSLKALSKSKKPGAVVSEGVEIGTEYEKELYAGVKKEGYKCEQVRVAEAVALANQYLVLIDCTDSEDTPHKIGRGGIPEVAHVLRNYFRKNKMLRPRAIWIDHLSALADRMAEASSTDDEKLHLILKRMPRQAADKLSKPFKCPVALLHQLSGEANQRSVASRYHHSDGAGSKQIGEYVDFAIVTGPPNKQGLCQWACTKHRREPATNERVVQILGQFNTLMDVTTLYHVDPSNGITARSEFDAHEAHAKMSKGGKGKGDDDDGIDLQM